MNKQKIVLEFMEAKESPKSDGMYFVDQSCWDKDGQLIGFEWGFSEFKDGAWVRIEGVDGSFADVHKWCMLPHPQLIN